MNAVHVHLFLNHVPILGTLFGILILAVGLLFKKGTLVNTGLIIFILMAAITPVVNESGKGAAGIIREMPEIDKEFIKAHGKLAKTGLKIMISLGVLSLIVLIFHLLGKSAGRILAIFTVFVAAGAFAWMVRVGAAGGEIRHTEIRGEPVTVQPEESDSDTSGRDRGRDRNGR